MSTLGLSGLPEPSDGLWKGLFWPTIHNERDADLAASRGFWVCLVLAFVSSTANSGDLTVVVGLSVGSYLDLAIFLFYFLGAVGVRQGSVAASASMFVTYLLGSVLYFWFSPFHFSFIRLVGTALLLTNLRAAFLIRNWRNDPLRQDDLAYGPTRLNSTWKDRIADQMPTKVWPWGRILFYALAATLIPLECIEMATLIIRHP